MDTTTIRLSDEVKTLIPKPPREAKPPGIANLLILHSLRRRMASPRMGPMYSWEVWSWDMQRRYGYVSGDATLEVWQVWIKTHVT